MRLSLTAMLLGSFMGSAGCFVQGPPPPVPGATPNLLQLNGRWTVQATTFPMWLEPDHRCPVFAYEPIETHGWVADRVLYLDEDDPEEIAGTDSQDYDDLLHFTWRGDGLLFFLKSEWYVRAMGPNWMVIYFTETLFSPEGVDVLARGPHLDEATWENVDRAVDDDPLLARFAPDLKPLDRSKCPKSHAQ